jgi:uncharacterized protein YjbI with pentapeptide repeats
VANPEHARALSSGKATWRKWRKGSTERPDLSGGDFRGLDLSHLDLSNADLRGAYLRQSSFRGSKLVDADLSGCDAGFAVFSEAKLTGAKLAGADLRASSLRRADLTGADLRRAILRFASLVGATVTDVILTHAEVYGASAWNLKGEPADQKGLIIREREGAVTTTVDDLDTAQLLFLLRENTKIADIIDTASQRTVLLLGRFKSPYKKVLDALKAHLLARNLVPVVFDFKGPKGRDLTETVTSLAHMACFVIPDLSGVKSVPQELSHIVPFLPSVPVVPVIAAENPPAAKIRAARQGAQEALRRAPAALGGGMKTLVRVVVGLFALLVVAIAALVVVARLSDGPIAVFAGGPFTSGELVTGPEPDWSFVRDVREIEFQLLDPPRSRITWVLDHDGKAYIPSGYMTTWWGKLWKQWPREAEGDPRVLLRIGDDLYERRLVRIREGPEVAPLLAQLGRKYVGGTEIPLEAVTSDNLWLFELAPRD